MEFIFEFLSEIIAYFIGLNVRYYCLKPFRPRLSREALAGSNSQGKWQQDAQYLYNFGVGLLVLILLFVGIYFIFK